MLSETAAFMNIIVFFTDQQRWDTLGVNGNNQGLTPNLDRFARQGTFFREAVTPQPVCGPARSCLQTGQYATTTGVWRNGFGLRPDSPKLAECFNAAGYRTGYIGKWHLSEGTGPGAVPAKNRGGYQDWLGANCVELTSGPYSARLWDKDDREQRLSGYRSDAMVDAAIRYIGQRSLVPDQPFMLWLSLLEPHHQNTDDSYPAPRGHERDHIASPLPPDLQSLGGSAAKDWAGYCAIIQRIDQGLGRLNDALESSGLREDTMIVFISDHGCHFKTRNSEYKRSPHDVSLRVPMVFWGQQWNGGGEQTCAASLVDLAPTLLEAAGLEVPPAMQGKSLLPKRKGQDSELADTSYSQFGDIGMAPGRCLRTSRWKYAVTASNEYRSQGTAPEYHETHLYDLQTDPYELANLVDLESHRGICDGFRETLLERMASLGEPRAEILPPEKIRPAGQRTVDYPV